MLSLSEPVLPATVWPEPGPTDPAVDESGPVLARVAALSVTEAADGVATGVVDDPLVTLAIGSASTSRPSRRNRCLRPT